jgi:hypothetical protein
MVTPPELWVLIGLLALGATCHAAALLALVRHGPLLQRGLATLGQVALLAVTAGTGVRVLVFSMDPVEWLPLRTTTVVLAAGWLALVVFLCAGYWWRSPGTAIILPVVVAVLLVVSEVTDGAASVRGAPALPAWRPRLS